MQNLQFWNKLKNILIFQFSLPRVIEWRYPAKHIFLWKATSIMTHVLKRSTTNSSDFTNGFYLKTHRRLSKYSCPIFRQDLFCLKIHIIMQEQLSVSPGRCLMPRAGPALLPLQLPCSCHPGEYWFLLHPDIFFARPKSHSAAERDPSAVHALAPWSSPFPLTLSGCSAFPSLLPCVPSDFVIPSYWWFHFQNGIKFLTLKVLIA